jgi:hypothetical protein
MRRFEVCVMGRRLCSSSVDVDYGSFGRRERHGWQGTRTGEECVRERADAIGLALFATVGAERATSAGASPLVAIIMGAITACFGGIIRDLLGQTRSIIFSYEIYVTAAVGAATVFIGCHSIGLSREIAIIAGITTGLVLRAGALLWVGHFRITRVVESSTAPDDNFRGECSVHRAFVGDFEQLRSLRLVKASYELDPSFDLIEHTDLGLAIPAVFRVYF